MNNFREIMDRLKQYYGVKTDKAVGEKLGVNANTIKTWSNRGKVPMDTLLKSIQNETISTDWLLTGEGEPKRKKAVVTEPKAKIKQITPVLDKEGIKQLQNKLMDEIVSNAYIVTKLTLEASAGDGIEHYHVEEQEVLLDKTLFRHPVNENNLRMIPVKGDSMEPTILDESHIIIDISQRENIDGIYAINLGGSIMVKRLQFNLDGNIEIISDNPKYERKIYNPKESQIHFEILGKKILSIQ